MKDIDLLVVGDCNPDLVLAGDVVPRFGQIEQLVEASLVIGGSASILACGAARLGLKTTLASVVGDDTFGHFMRASLERRGVATDALAIDTEATTGLSVILATAVDRAILTHLGTIDAVARSHVPNALLARARHVHIASYYLLAALWSDAASLLAAAQELGATTSLDTNWDPSERFELDDVLDHVDILMPNAAEAIRIAKVDTVDAALTHLATRVPTVVAKHGADGGEARRGHELVRASALPIEVVDSVGAGDSFGAGFLCGHLTGLSLDASLRLAVACGSLSTRAAGGTDAQPTLAEAST